MPESLFCHHTGLFCLPRQPRSFSCLPSLPLLQSVISTYSLSASLDSLQHKDLFSQPTADLRVFKVSSASKRRKQAGREKNNKIMALLKPPVECEWISALHSRGLSISLWAPNFSDFLSPSWVYLKLLHPWAPLFWSVSLLKS